MRQDHLSERLRYPRSVILSAVNDVLQVSFEGGRDRNELLDVDEEVGRFKRWDNGGFAFFGECPQGLSVILPNTSRRISALQQAEGFLSPAYLKQTRDLSQIALLRDPELVQTPADFFNIWLSCWTRRIRPTRRSPGGFGRVGWDDLSQRIDESGDRSWIISASANFF